MDKFYKIILENGEIGIGGGESIPIGAVEITEAEFNEMLKKKEDYNSKIRSYREQVNRGEITLKEVPEEYRAEVEAQVNPTGPDSEQAVVDSIMQEVSSYGY